MPSRLDEYRNDSSQDNFSRTEKNKKLYKIYSELDDFDNLPLEDNSDEIDIERLKGLISSSNNQNENKMLRESLNILDTRKRKINEEKIYDINKILEKAKNDNSKLKEPTIRETLVDKSLLSTLESTELSLTDIKEASLKYENSKIEETVEFEEDDMTMTREFKFKKLSEEVEKFNSNPLTEHVMSDNSLPLDLFEELKPTGNTIVTKPITEYDNKKYEPNMHSTDTKDIDILKPNTNNLEEFFTSSYEFTKKDFALINEEDDFFETKKDNNIFKVILLILAIIVFSIAIVCFIKTYGLGL